MGIVEYEYLPLLFVQFSVTFINTKMFYTFIVINNKMKQSHNW